MPLEHSILNLHGYKIDSIEGNYPIVIQARCVDQPFCPFCQNTNLRKKDTFIRKIRHESFGNRISFIYLQAHKFKCTKCLRYFNQRFPGILKSKRSSEGFRREIFQKHFDGISQKTLAHSFAIGTATVERWYHDFLKKTVLEKINYNCPQIIGIDEHFFTKKKGYATTICDLKSHRVFDVILGRSEASLNSYFIKLKGKDKVKIVVMDLSETYRAIIKKHFPQAKIVSDRFHVIRLINHHFLNLWKQIDPAGKYNRGLLSLMRRHHYKLSTEQKIDLYKYFEKYPELRPIYQIKQELCELLCIKHQTRKECRDHIPRLLWYIKHLKESLLEPFVTLAKTLESWSEEVARMWRFTKSNGITEGFHTKMEMISRRAYGFKNFENYRLRVRALCS